MTAHMTDLEIIEQIPFMDDSEEDHLACTKCWPDDSYPPGTMINAVCGLVEEATVINEVDGRDGITCDKCKKVNFCPQCGDRIWT